MIKPEARAQFGPEQLIIRDLLVRHRQLIENATMEKNRYHIMPKFMRGDIQRHINHIQKQIEKLDKHLSQSMVIPPFLAVLKSRDHAARCSR